MLQQTIAAASATFPELAQVLEKAIKGLQVSGAPPPPPSQEAAEAATEPPPQVLAGRLRNKISKADQRIAKCKEYIAAVDAELSEIEQQTAALKAAREERAARVQTIARERRGYRRQYEQVMARIEAQEVLSSSGEDEAADEDMSVAGAPIVRMARDAGDHQQETGDEDEDDFAMAAPTPTGSGDPIGGELQVQRMPMVVPPPQVVLPPAMHAGTGGRGAVVPVLCSTLPTAPGLLEAARAKRARSESAARRHGAAQQRDGSFAALAESSDG